MRSAYDVKISGIIPTLGRADMLDLCLQTLVQQTVPVAEVLIVHCGDDPETPTVASDPRWKKAGIDCRYFKYPEKNAANQRHFAIKEARYDNLLLLDDDVELEREWVQELFAPIWADSKVGATMGNILNQAMPVPPPIWRLYRRIFFSGALAFEPGRVFGAVVHNAFPLNITKPMPTEWIGGGCSALRREAYESVGGFSSFFTGSSPHEDLDLGYRLSRRWKVLYVPTARCIHHQAPGRREHDSRSQYLSVRSRYAIQVCSIGRSKIAALLHTALWICFQDLSELVGLLRGRAKRGLLRVWLARFRALISCIGWVPSAHASCATRALPPGTPVDDLSEKTTTAMIKHR